MGCSESIRVKRLRVLIFFTNLQSIWRIIYLHNWGYKLLPMDKIAKVPLEVPENCLSSVSRCSIFKYVLQLRLTHLLTCSTNKSYRYLPTQLAVTQRKALWISACRC